MGVFLRKAEEILDVAAAGNSGDMLLVVDRQGAIRILDGTGWSLPAASVEYGAAAAYKVERRGRSVRVEGMSGAERCLLQRDMYPRPCGVGLLACACREAA